MVHSSLAISLGFYQDQLLYLHLENGERREHRQEKYIGGVDVR